MQHALFFLFFLLFPGSAHAYLDPGTGSMILQIIAGSLLAALYTIKIYWKRIKTFFGRK